jgi:aspartate carbamoyltransferase catalytic subunit
MTAKKRDINSINDLTNAEIEEIFSLTDEYLEMMWADRSRPQIPLRGRLREASGLILATLFYEPSTRTRLSFESAMIRLGGGTLGTTDSVNSSVVKGESIADTVRVIENYADLIVIRHKLSGAARVASEYASIPIINAGDGTHEHPTQTLCDLYTLRKELGKGQKQLRDATVLVIGDLKYGRTVHSLVYALARFGVNVVTMPAKGFELPETVDRRLREEYGCISLTGREISEVTEKLPLAQQVYLPLTRNLEPDLFSDRLGNKVSIKGVLKKIDACYVTRLQDERLLGDEGLAKDYPIIDRNFLKGKHYTHTLVLHPLPRVGELGYDLDADPRALYFKQMAYSVPIRMALMAKILGIRPFVSHHEKGTDEKQPALYVQREGLRCENASCVSGAERLYLSNKFLIVGTSPVALRCQYCDHVVHPLIVGSVGAKTYSAELESVDATQLGSKDTVFFASEAQAKEAGFRHGSPAARSHNSRVA